MLLKSKPELGYPDSMRCLPKPKMQLPDAIPYQKLMAHAQASGRPIDEFLREQLPLFWQDAYDAMLARPSDVMVFTYGTFDYWFDTYQQPEPYDPSSGKLPI